MADFLLSLVSTRQETPDVQSFRFVAKGVIPFEAGQFLRLTLPQVKNDPRGQSRFLSFASSPTEKEFIMVATKISASPFKKALAALSVGQKASLEGPFGRFTLDQDEVKQHVFLSGGIGITPFRSMIKYATDQKLPHKIVLFYSNRTLEDIVFKGDLDELTKANPNITIAHTITRPPEPAANNTAMKQPARNAFSIADAGGSNNNVYWKTGRIDEAMIKRYVNDIANAIFYIAGPPSMVEALTEVVKGMGVSEENIKTERFTGYQ